MFAAIQATTIWLTTAMLLAQAIYPGLALNCGCQHSISSSCVSKTTGINGCCYSKPEDEAPSACSHCQASSPADEATRQGRSVCHCGDHAPSQPALPNAPDSPSSIDLVDWICGSTTCLTTASMLPSAPVHAQVPSSESLVPHFKQVLLCVWLT